MLTLQRQVGNSLINRLLAQRETDALVAREEDEKKEKVEGAAPEPATTETAPPPALGESKKNEEDDESKKVMAKHDPADSAPEVGMEGGPISDGLASRIQASRGNGSPLDDGARTKMEGGFGTSFDRVRVHTDGESDALNHKLGAKAFTTGNDIYFRQDTSPSDHGLLAHELTHVVQQRDMSSGSTMHVGPAGDTYEANADSMSDAVNSSSAAPAAQRQVDEH
jgi:hypothetical protein